MQSIDIALAVVAVIALVLAYVGWIRKDPAVTALLNAKQAEADAKDGLIQRLQGEIDELSGYKIKAERIPELEAEVEKVRGERDSYFGKASEHDNLTRQLDDLTTTLAEANTKIAGLNQLVSSKEETVKEANSRAAAAEGERDRIRQEVDGLKTASNQLQKSVTELTGELESTKSALDSEKQLFAEKSRLLDEAEKALKDAFGNLSLEALRNNNAAFLNLAKETFQNLQSSTKQDLDARDKAIAALVDPVKDTLTKFDAQVQELEKTRTSAYASLTTQLQTLAQTQDYLRQETGNLVKALRAPQIRGRWGELTLKRVVEMAGMLDHCDFIEQESSDTDDGRQRPDMIIRMPGNRKIIVDAKVPLTAYLEAVEAQDDDTKRQKLADHARQLRDHVTKLSRKSYWEQYKNETPEFVVLFIPGEVFYAAALEFDPSLIEQATNDKVMLASPANLIPLLRAVHYGWKQEAIAKNAIQISDLGKELYDRLGKLADHWADVGKHLGNSVKAYNNSIGTLETRVLVSARKFQELKAASADKDIEAPVPIETSLRDITAAELLPAPD